VIEMQEKVRRMGNEEIIVFDENSEDPRDHGEELLEPANSER
jgi:hypothetical protein